MRSGRASITKSHLYKLLTRHIHENLKAKWFVALIRNTPSLPIQVNVKKVRTPEEPMLFFRLAALWVYVDGCVVS